MTLADIIAKAGKAVGRAGIAVGKLFYSALYGPGDEARHQDAEESQNDLSAEEPQTDSSLVAKTMHLFDISEPEARNRLPSPEWAKFVSETKSSDPDRSYVECTLSDARELGLINLWDYSQVTKLMAHLNISEDEIHVYALGDEATEEDYFLGYGVRSESARGSLELALQGGSLRGLKYYPTTYAKAGTGIDLEGMVGRYQQTHDPRKVGKMQPPISETSLLRYFINLRVLDVSHAVEVPRPSGWGDSQWDEDEGNAENERKHELELKGFDILNKAKIVRLVDLCDEYHRMYDVDKIKGLENLASAEEIDISCIGIKDLGSIKGIEALPNLRKITAVCCSMEDPFSYVVEQKRKGNFPCLSQLDISDNPEINYYDSKIWENVDALENMGVKILGLPQVMPEKKPNYRDSLTEKLMDNGFHEEDARAVVGIFDKNIEDGKKVSVNSKNQVYFLTDKHGNRKVIRFHGRSKEDEEKAKEAAEAEIRSVYEFSRNPALCSFVPWTNMKEPYEIDNGEYKSYMTIQEDTRFRPKRKLSLEEWMKVLARFHVIGTRLMNKAGITRKAKGSIDERYDEMIRVAGVDVDWSQRKAIAESGIEAGVEYINSDIKRENIDFETGVVYDWDSAGRGNSMKDVAAFISDASVDEYLSECRIKNLLETYLNEKRWLQTHFTERFIPVNHAEVETAYNEFMPLAVAYRPKFAAYKMLQKARGEGLTLHEEKSIEFFVSEQGELEKKSILVSGIKMTETDESVVYEMPTSHIIVPPSNIVVPEPALV